jgi:5,10-methylene-tetrahydrofolate dehydrogenase/methenyl tetrahydrofolate cyclohydrolase
LNNILPEKDVDGITDENLARLSVLSDLPYCQPCTPGACLQILREYNIELNSKRCLIINRSRVVGLPLFHLLLQRNATVTICHGKTENLEEQIKNHDIIFTAMGKPGIIKSEWIKPGSVVIDISTNFIKHEGHDKLIGDLIFHEVISRLTF